MPSSGEDGSLMIAADEGREADSYWLTFSSAGDHGCQRIVHLGFRPAPPSPSGRAFAVAARAVRRRPGW